MEIRIQPLQESKFNISLVTEDGVILQLQKNLDIRELNTTYVTYSSLLRNSSL